MGSADIMPRNLDRRVEVLFPIEDECLKARVRREIFDLAFADNVKMRRLQPDGSYFRPPQASDARVNSQAALLAAANHETSNHETHETYEK
jgi:polyphosphate kinase